MSQADSAVAENLFRKVVPNPISECSLASRGDGRTCAPRPVVEAVHETLGTRGDSLESAAKKVGCATEKCALERAAQQAKGKEAEIIRLSLRVDYKLPGPTNDKLLSNVVIDNTLHQWAHSIPGFFAYNFNMLNYAKHAWRDNAVQNYPDSLASISAGQLVRPGEPLSTGVKVPGVPVENPSYHTAGCVINSDVYQNGGKHWMALFLDARGASWSVEFFNSSGNSPAPEWINWLTKTRSQLEDIAGKLPDSPRVSIQLSVGRRQQHSKTECGVYSLFYIWARLAGVPPSEFTATPIHDKYMFEFRQHLFGGEKAVSDGKFDWAAYQKEVPIKWESARPSH